MWPFVGNPPDHPHAYPKCPHVARVSALARPDSIVKGDRALDDMKRTAECHVEKMRIELEIDRAIQHWQQFPDGGVAAQLVGRPDVCKRPLADVFGFEEFPDEEVSVIHERRELRAGSP